MDGLIEVTAERPREPKRRSRIGPRQRELRIRELCIALENFILTRMADERYQHEDLLVHHLRIELVRTLSRALIQARGEWTGERQR